MTLPPACPAVGYPGGQKAHLESCWADRFGTEKYKQRPRCNRYIEATDELGLCAEHRDQLLGKLVDMSKVVEEEVDAMTAMMQEAGVLGMMPASWVPVDIEED